MTTHPPDAPSSSLRAGDLLAGRYRVEALIGRGGFGAVFRGDDAQIGRPVAIKVMLPQPVAPAEGLARFRREAELARALEHPNTVRLYDFGTCADGTPFIVFELLAGQSLDAVLADSGPFDLQRVARIAAQVLMSLMEAHARGVVHRDVKPSNIMLCSFSGAPDFVKVLDFGIAHVLGSDITNSAALIGTPAYMAPEQVGGGDVGPASDVYALGLVMAELLSGQRVFASDAALAVAVAKLNGKEAALPAEVVGGALGPVIVRATRSRPEERFHDATEMLAALEQAAPLALFSPSRAPPPALEVANAPTELARLLPITVPPTELASRPLPAAPTELAPRRLRRAMRFAVAGVAVVGLVAAGALAALGWSRASPPIAAASATPHRPTSQAPEQPPGPGAQPGLSRPEILALVARLDRTVREGVASRHLRYARTEPRQQGLGVCHQLLFTRGIAWPYVVFCVFDTEFNAESYEAGVRSTHLTHTEVVRRGVVVLYGDVPDAARVLPTLFPR